ncbi:hypothetical protein ACF1AJ_13510 [Leifsonia sp. NPDC014704]|uniref:hypothetical protein n=1 Tax=Leifsonia sp. NPDC014704 TaxID=3364123 RepID=UPI0036F45464
MSDEPERDRSLRDLIALQQQFDSERSTTFDWSSPVTRNDVRPLLHNVLSLAGEVGEVANLVKKYDRGDFGFDTLISELPGELADVAIYLMKLAYQSGIDLEKAILDKMSYNESRFPKDDSARVELSSHWVFRKASTLAESLTDQATGVLTDAYVTARLRPPTAASALVAGALLALEVAQSAKAEGDRSGHLARWEELRPAAEDLGLSYEELVRLARSDLAISSALSSATAPTARPHQ